MPIDQDPIQNFYNAVVRPQLEAEMNQMINPGPPPCVPKDDFARSLTPEQRGETRERWGRVAMPPDLAEATRQARQRLLEFQQAPPPNAARRVNNLQNLMQGNAAYAPFADIEPLPPLPAEYANGEDF